MCGILGIGTRWEGHCSSRHLLTENITKHAVHSRYWLLELFDRDTFGLNPFFKILFEFLVYEIFSETLFGDTSKPYSNLEIVYKKQIWLQIGFEPIVTKTTVFAPNQKRLWRGLRNILAWHINSLTGQASRQLYDCYSYLTKGGNKIFLTNKNLNKKRHFSPFNKFLHIWRGNKSKIHFNSHIAVWNENPIKILNKMRHLKEAL